MLKNFRLANQYERAKHDVNHLKNVNSRLEKERDILTRQTSGSAMIAENLKLVQLKLEQADSETRMRLQNQNEDLTKEVNLLRKKLESEQESYHKSVQAWESAQLESRSKIDTLKESDANLKAQVEELNNSIEEVRHQLKISQEKLALVQAGSSSGSGKFFFCSLVLLIFIYLSYFIVIDVCHFQNCHKIDNDF